jgi:hypothetical protein
VGHTTEKTEAENAKAIAEAYQKNQIAHFDQLIVSNYTLNNTPPQLDWQHTVNKSEKTIIYDRFRKCIGYAYQGNSTSRFTTKEFATNGTWI